MRQLLVLVLAVGVPAAVLGFISKKEVLAHQLSIPLCVLLSLLIIGYLAGESPGAAFGLVTEHEGWAKLLTAYAQVLSPVATFLTLFVGLVAGWNLPRLFASEPR